MNKNKNLAFTLAEVLIVIGIIGVVAALTLPNLNHATGDKETVTRLQKAYSILNEANDRAVAIYGPISSWYSNEQCAEDPDICWMNRIGEFLKISKSCNERSNNEDPSYTSCNLLIKGDMDADHIAHQLADGISFGPCSYSVNSCTDTEGEPGYFGYMNDLCFSQIVIDINGPSKGKNEFGKDIFYFMVSDSKGIVPIYDGYETITNAVHDCISSPAMCSWWILEYGNLDYLKSDSSGKCNDSNIILDGVTNTSCH